jgi:acyl-CoA synthetase (NDP forming)
LQIFDAAVRQAGAVRVDRMEELVDTVIAFRHLRALRGPRAGIVGMGGGNSVLASDEIGSHGLEMPALPDDVQRKLRDFTPTAGTSVRNPVDTNVGWGPDGLKPMLDTIRIMAEAPNIDYVLYHTGWGWGPGRSGAPDIVEMAKGTGEALGQLAAEAAKPIVCVSRTPTSEPGMAATLAFTEAATAHGIATFSSVASAALALRRVLTWQGNRDDFTPSK